MKRYLLLLALGTCIGFTSCSKDDDKKPADPQTNTPQKPEASAKTKMLSAKPWKLESLTNNGQDMMNNPLFPNCNKDDLYKFNTDSTITVNDGVILCPSNPSNGTWEFKNNETIINLTIPSISLVATGDFTLESLSETTLVLSKVQTIAGTNSTFVATFKAQ